MRNFVCLICFIYETTPKESSGRAAIIVREMVNLKTIKNIMRKDL